MPLHVPRKVAGHGNIATTQRYLHPDHQSIIEAGNALSAYLTRDGTTGPQLVPSSNSTADELGHVIQLKKAR
ncbi:hypothetical protein [Saccharopolyspora mangrovi]|uniref:hypothetical protein n=1 Tax=Saccharopolyspora mangrovi TaxID=3082379 RepID=UPI002B4BB744|nr:hypothetical protein [Saccharopolyspora sp. S2-29]